MITLDITNVDARQVGDANGLNLEAEFKAYQSTMAQSIERLYATKDEAGGWKRWLNLGYDTQLANDLEAYAKRVQDQFKGELDDIVILGIGGSSLGGYALLRALLHPYWNNLSKEQRNGLPRYHFVENVDPDQVVGLLDVINPAKTLFNVISKSGTTAETMSAYLYFQERLLEKLGSADALKKHLVMTTDAKTGILRGIVNELGLESFEVPDDVGGRFSVFSAVGLLPAALCGINLKELLRGITDLDKALQNSDLSENMAAQGALIQYLLYQRGKHVSVFMPYSYRLASVADWFVQLWAESLGKKVDKDGRVVNVGPTALKAVGATDQHSQIQLYNEGPFDKVTTFVAIETPEHNALIGKTQAGMASLDYLSEQPFHKLLNAEFEATRASLTRNQRPNLTIHMPKVDAYHFAQLLYLLEVQTALAGDLFHIDPFDQPGVELAKKYTYALMGQAGFEQLIAEIRPQACV